MCSACSLNGLQQRNAGLEGATLVGPCNEDWRFLGPPYHRYDLFAWVPSATLVPDLQRDITRTPSFLDFIEAPMYGQLSDPNVSVEQFKYKLVTDPGIRSMKAASVVS